MKPAPGSIITVGDKRALEGNYDHLIGLRARVSEHHSQGGMMIELVGDHPYIMTLWWIEDIDAIPATNKHAKLSLERYDDA